MFNKPLPEFEFLKKLVDKEYQENNGRGEILVLAIKEMDK